VIYTDGSKIEGKVGAGAVIYVNQALRRQGKYKLHNSCSNNQAEQVAILKALDELASHSDHNGRTVAIYTDSKLTLASLRNSFIHSPLIVDIRNKVRQLMDQNWLIYYGWVKAHSGIEKNELEVINAAPTCFGTVYAPSSGSSKFLIKYVYATSRVLKSK
jgi:ribonuclease HI